MATYILKTRIKGDERKSAAMIAAFNEAAGNYSPSFIVAYPGIIGDVTVIAIEIVATDYHEARYALFAIQASTNSKVAKSDILPFFADFVGELVQL
jgi:hypothetical protein